MLLQAALSQGFSLPKLQNFNRTKNFMDEENAETKGLRERLAQLQDFVAAKFGYQPTPAKAPDLKPQVFNPITRSFQDAPPSQGLQRMRWDFASKQWIPDQAPAQLAPEVMVRCKVSNIAFRYEVSGKEGAQLMTRDAGASTQINGYLADEKGEFIIPLSLVNWLESVTYPPSARLGWSTKHQIERLEVYAPKQEAA
jgi:hypothetical protein